MDSHAQSVADSPIIDRLLPSERQMMYLVCSGMSYREIGDLLKTTAPAVKHKLDRTYRKLGVRCRSEATMRWLAAHS